MNTTALVIDGRPSQEAVIGTYLNCCCFSLRLLASVEDVVVLLSIDSSKKFRICRFSLSWNE